MRSDALKRHIRSHKDILGMSDEDARDELRVRHSAYLHREERRQEIEEIARQENIPLEHCGDLLAHAPSLAVSDVFTLREELLYNNQRYLDKIELGKQVVSVIAKGIVQEESLAKNYKDALDMYRKQRPHIDIQTVQLRPWQQVSEREETSDIRNCSPVI